MPATEDQHRPLIVLDDPAALPGLRARLAQSGWRVQDGWLLPEQQWDVAAARIVCAGQIGERAQLEAALLAAVRGAGLIIITPPPLPDAFLEDLARIGTVERRTSDGVFDADTIDLLRTLAAGKAVAVAAAENLISLRTAHRRLTAARSALGVKTNRELLTEFARRDGGSG